MPAQTEEDRDRDDGRDDQPMLRIQSADRFQSVGYHEPQLIAIARSTQAASTRQRE